VAMAVKLAGKLRYFCALLMQCLNRNLQVHV
jgi:hypothetical protein